MSEWGRTDMPARKGRSPWPFSLGLVVGAVVAAAAVVFFLGGLNRGGDPSGLDALRAAMAGKDAEIARLEARIAELDTGSGSAQTDESVAAARREADELRARLKLAEGASGQLQAEYDRAVNQDIPALEAELEKRDTTLKAFDAEIARLSDVEAQVKQLQADKAAATGDRQEVERLRGEIAARDATLARLDAELTRLGSVERERDALRQARDDAGSGEDPARKALQDELDRARAQITTAKGAVAAREAELAAAKADIGRRDATLAQLDAEVTRLSTAETDLGSQLEAARAEAADLRSQLETARAEAADLRSQIAALSKPAAPRADTPQREPDTAGREATPRDPLRVARAMSEAHGLENLSDAERDRLATGLIEGSCVSQALSGVFGRAPAVAMRDLIRSLDSDC